MLIVDAMNVNEFCPFQPGIMCVKDQMKDCSFAPIRTTLSCLYGPKNDTNACNSRLFRPPKSTVLLPQALSYAVKGSNDDQEVMKESNLLPAE
jgi:hypothetical protein